MASKALIALAAISGLLNGVSSGRQRRFENMLKMKEIESKSGTEAQKQITDAMKNYQFYRSIKDQGGSPADQNAFGVFARGANKYGFDVPDAPSNATKKPGNRFAVTKKAPADSGDVIDLGSYVKK